jgi:plastocyanin
MSYGRSIGLGAIVAALAACGGGSGGMGGTVSATGGGSPDGGAAASPTPTPTGNTTDGGATGGTSTAFTLTIQGMAFSPENLTVPAGGTVQVVNMDGTLQHSVTSQSTVGAYVFGSVGGVSFDTGLFTGTRSFTIAAGAANGTVIPYFCRNHGPLMANATRAQITIGTPTAAPTTPTTPTTPTMPTTPMTGGPGMY